MLRYLDTECPVCKRMFEEGDDIVTCPECGTPHHRECYNLIGKCVNSGLHASGFEFGEVAPKHEEKLKAIVGEYYSPNGEEATSESTDKEPKASPFAEMNEDSIEKEYSSSSETIDENPIVDVAFFVRSNIARFLPKFRKMEKNGSKLGWNWSAFIFGGLYYMFRKMYAQGAALIGLFTAILIGSNAMIYKYAPEYSQAAMDLAQAYAQREQIDPSSIMNVADYAIAGKIVAIAMIIILVLRICEATIFDYIYKKHIAKSIKSINENIEENSVLFQSPMMSADNMSPERMKKMYLARKGGTSFFSAMTGALIAYMIITLF